MPGASENKLRAIVFNQIQQIKYGKKEEVDKELTFKPDISRSMASKPQPPMKSKRRHFKTSQSLTGRSGTQVNNDAHRDSQLPDDSDVSEN